MVDSVEDFLIGWKARMFFLGGRGTTGGLGARFTEDIDGFGMAFCTVVGDSTLFLREIAGEASDDGVDGEDLAVLGPKYFIRSTSLGFLLGVGEPSTLDTEDGVPLALGLVGGAGFALGKYLARLTPCKADTSLLGSCFGFASILAPPVKNFETSFSLLTPTMRGPSTADLMDCMLLLNFCASTFFMRRSSAAWSCLIFSRKSSASSRTFGRLRRFKCGVLRPLLLHSLRSSLNMSSKATSSGCPLETRLPEEGVGEGVAGLCLRCFLRDGVGDPGTSCFFKDGVGDGACLRRDGVGDPGTSCFFSDGVGDGACLRRDGVGDGGGFGED